MNIYYQNTILSFPTFKADSCLSLAIFQMLLNQVHVAEGRACLVFEIALVYALVCVCVRTWGH